MNTFVGNITVEGKKELSLDYDTVISYTQDGNTHLFLFGKTEQKNSQELLESLVEKCGKILDHDMSISSEDKLSILWESYKEGIYELVSFEGIGVEFSEIQKRFLEFEDVVSVREAEISRKFWNRVIKVDFVY